MKNFIARTRITLLLLLAPLLISCSSGFLYNNLSRISLWYIDDYVTLNSKQQKAYATEFSELQQWHREYELKHYQAFLSGIDKKTGAEQLSKQDLEREVASYHQEARSLWANLVRRASTHLHKLTQEMSDQQKQELIQNLQAKNRDHYEKMQAMSKSEWQEYKVKRLKKNISRWIGSFTSTQKQQVQQWTGELISLDQEHFEFRKHWLQQLEASLKLPGQESKAQLEQLLTSPESFMTEAYRQKLKKNRALTESLIAHLLLARTAKQQKTLVREIDDWMDLINRVIQS